MARLNWTDQALGDLVNIADFIAKDSVKYAVITVKRIRIAAKQLHSYQLSGRMVPELARKNIMEPITGFRIRRSGDEEEDR